MDRGGELLMGFVFRDFAVPVATGHVFLDKSEHWHWSDWEMFREVGDAEYRTWWVSLASCLGRF